MKEMYHIIKPYRCQVCNQDMLFFLTANNVLIDYKGLFGRTKNLYKIRQYLEQRRIKYIKCLSCNKIYIIDWTQRYPTQLLDKSCLEKFGV